MVKKANGLINENDSEQKLRTVIEVKDGELEKIFNKILKDLENCIVLEMCPREKLPKLKLASDIEESAKRILDEYLLEDKNIPYISGKVYVIESGIAIKSEIV